MQTLRHHRKFLGWFMTCLMAVWLPGQSLQAAVLYWDADADASGNLVSGTGLGGSGVWNTSSTNWWDGVALSDQAWINGSDTAVFAGTAGLVTLGTAITAGGIIFEPTSSGFRTLAGGGNTLTLNGGVTANQNAIISANVALGAAQTWTVADGIQLTASGILSGGSGSGITKAGDGMLVLTGVNTFTGPLELSAGILRATTSAQALGTGTATLSLGGGELQLANDAALTFARNTTVTANVVIASDRLNSGAGVNHTLGTLAIGGQTLQMKAGNFVTSGTAQVTFGATTLSGNSTFSVGGPATGTSIIAGMPMLSLGALNDGGASRSITKAGNGILELTANATVFTAGTTMNVSGGTLRLRAANAFSSGVNTGALNFSGGHLELFTAAGTTFNNSITLGASNATITLSGASARNAMSQTLGALSLGSTLTIAHGSSLNTNFTDSLTFGATTLTANATIVTNNVNGNATGTVALGAVGDGGGNFTLTKMGAGTLSLNSGASTFGALVIYSGLNPSNVSVGTFDVSGSATMTGVPSITATRNTTLQLNNTSGTGNVADRLSDTASIGLTGATFSFANTAQASTNYSESVGVMTINAGANVINSSQAAAGQTSVLTVADLVRSGAATLNFTGTGLGDNTRNQQVYTLIGGAAPTANQFIGGWATVNGADFAKWDTAGTPGSIRALQAADYTGTFGASNNVRLTASGTAGTAARSLNLAQASATTLSITAGTTLNIDDGSGVGGLLVSGAFNSTIQSSTTTAATLTAGTTAGAQLVIHTYSAAANPLTLSSTNAVTIANNAGGAVTLVKTGTGTLVLNTAATYTGGTILNQGSLRINHVNALGASNNALTLNGGVLELGNNTAQTYGYNTTVADRATVAINHLYTAGAAGVTHTFGTLNIGTSILNMASSTNVTNNTAYGVTFGATTLSGNPTFNVANNGTGTGTLTLALSDGGGIGRTITKTGAGVLALTALPAESLNFVLGGGTVQLRTAAGATASTGVEGINAYYFNGGNFGNGSSRFATDQLFTNTRVFTRTDAGINVPNSGGGTHPVIPVAGYSKDINDSAMWKGLLNITTAGTYQFKAINDDGAVLWIDGVQIGTIAVQPGITNLGSAVTLSAGQHSIFYQFGQGGGGGYTVLSYNGPDSGNADMIIPGSALSTGWLTQNIGALSVTASSTLDIAHDTIASSLTMGTATLTVASGTISNLYIDGSTVLSGNATFVASTGGLVFNGGISGTGNISVGTNALSYLTQFNAVNTYAGATTVNSGVLRLNATGGNSITGNLIVNVAAGSNGDRMPNVQLLQSNQIADSATLVLTSGFFDLNGRSETVSRLDMGGGTVFGGTLTVSNLGSGTITSGFVEGTIAGAGGLNKTGTGTLMWRGGGSYTGVTAISGGIFIAASTGSLGAGGAANGTTVSGTGLLLLQGLNASNSEIVTLNIANGLRVNGQATLDSLVYGAGVTADTLNIVAGRLTLAGATNSINGSAGNTNLTVDGRGELVIVSAPSLGLGTITKNGLGTLTFGYDVGASLPGVTHNAGALGFSGPQSFGTATVGAGLAYQFNSDPGAGVTAITANVGASIIASFAVNQAFLGRIASGSTGNLLLGADSSSNLDFSTGSHDLSLGAFGRVVYSGAITANGTVYRLGAANSFGFNLENTLVLTQTLTGAGNSVNVTASHVDLSRAVNTFGGALNINSGVVSFSNSSSLGDSSSVGNVVNLTNGGILRTAKTSGSSTVGFSLMGYSQPVAGSRTVVVGTGGGVIDVVANTLATTGLAFGGVNAIQGASGTTLTKSGAGTLFLLNSNDFAGEIVLAGQGGTLDLRYLGKLTSATSITVNQSAVLNIDEANGLGPARNGGFFANTTEADRIVAATTIHLAGGTFSFTTGNASGRNSEALGTVNLQTGQNLMNFTSNTPSGVGSDVSIASLNVIAGGTLRLGGGTPGTFGAAGANNTRLTFGTVTASNGVMLTHAGAAGVVMPFASLNTTDHIIYTGTGFAVATYTNNDVSGTAGLSINPTADTNVTRLRNTGADNTTSTFTLAGGAGNRYGVTGLSITGGSTGGGLGATNNITLAFTNNTDSLFVGASNSLGGGAIVSDGTPTSSGSRTNLIGAVAGQGILTAGAMGATAAQTLYIHHRTSNSGSNVAALTINSVIRDNPGANLIFGDGDDQALTLVKDNNGSTTLATANLYTGGTYIVGGRLVGNVAGAFGTGQVVVKNGGITLVTAGTVSGTAIPTATPVFNILDQSELYLSGGTAVYNNANDRFRVEAGSLLTGESDAAGQGLNSLTRVTTLTGGGQVILAAGAIVRSTSLSAAGTDVGATNMVQNLGTAADLYFNVDGGSALSYITVGAGTAWRGFAAGATAGNWRTGTIYANSDFEIQGTFGNGGANVFRLGRQDGGGSTAMSYSIVNLAGRAINAYIDGQVTMSEDTPLSLPADLTFVVRNGAVLTPEYTNSFGSGSNVAKVVVQAGGTLNPGNYAAVGLAANQPIGRVYPIDGPINASSTTIESGGRLLVNQASGLGTSPVGSILLKTNAVLHLAHAQSFLGANNGLINAGQIVLEPGVIVRAEASNIFRFTDFINSAPNGDKIILEMFNANVSMTAAANPMLTLNSATPYVEAQSITFGAGGGLTGDAVDSRQVAAPALAGAYGGAYVFNTGSFIAATSGSYLNIVDDIIVAAGQTVNIGYAGYVDGLPKLGGVQLLANNGNKIEGTLNILDGAQLSFNGVNVYNDTQSLTLSAAVTNLAAGGILPGTGSSLLLNNATAEVMGALLGNGAVIGNFNPSTLHTGYGNASYAFNGVFSGTGTQQVNIGKLGSGVMTLTGGASTSTGTLSVYNGTLTYSGAGASLFSAHNVFTGGTLLLDNSTTAVSSRLGGNTKNLTLAGGEFKLLGNSGAAVVEQLGTLGLSTSGGIGYVTVDPTGAAATTLNFAIVTNSNTANNGTTYVLRGPGMAGTPGTTAGNGVVTANPASNGLITATTPNLWSQDNSDTLPGYLTGLGGGGRIAGSIGTALAPVRVDILGDISLTGNGTGFVTMDTITSGFRLLADSEYYDGSRIVQNEALPINVKLAAGSTVNLTGGSTRIMSLTMLNGSALNATGYLPFSVNPARIQVTTGGIYVPTGATASITAPYLSPLTSSNINLYFHTQGNLTVNAALVLGTSRSSSLVKTGAGTLTLGAGALTNMAGAIYVHEGTLILSGGATQNSLFVTEPTTSNTAQYNGQRVTLNGGTFDLNAHNQIFGDLVSNGGLAANSSSSEINGGTLTSTGATRVVVQSVSGTTANTNVFAGTITGAITLDKSGASTSTVFDGVAGNLVLTRANSHTGGTIVRAGTLRLRDQGALTSAAGGITINQATLIADNTGLGNISDRIHDSAIINSRSGTLQLAGSRDAVTENVGTFNALLGLTTVQVGAGHSSKAELIIANLVRSIGSTVVMNASTFTGDYATGGGALGYPGDSLTNPRVFLTQIDGGAPLLNDGILGGWATSGTNFLSYSATNGVGELGNLAGGFANYAMNTGTGTFTTLSGSTSTADNIRLDAADTLASSKTVNSLLLAMSGARTVTLTGQTLTLDTGGLLITGNVAGTFTGGSLTSGGSELFITVNQNTTTMSTALTGSGVSLIKSGAGALTLTGDNTYNGTTYVNAGTLTLNRTNAGNAILGDLNINGGTVALAKVGQIPTAATITLNGGGSSLTWTTAAGWTDTLKKLVLNNMGGTSKVNISASAAGTLILTDPTPIVAVNDNTTSGILIANSVGAIQFAPSSGTTSTIDVSGLAPFGMSLSANITAVGAGGLIKTGAGLLAVGGTNTYVGATSQVWDIQAGILRADSAGALGNNTSDVTNVGANGTLLIFGTPTLTGQINLNGGVLGLTAGNSFIAITNGALNAVAATTSTINLSEFHIGTLGRTLTVAGLLTGSGNLNLVGPGLTSSGAAAILSLTNSANTYTGTITVNNNTTLTSFVAGGSGLGGAIVNLAGGTLSLLKDTTGQIYNNTVNLAQSSTINVDRATSGGGSGVTQTIQTLTIASGDQYLNVTQGNTFVLAVGTLNGPGTLIKRGSVGLTITALGTGGNTPGFGLAGADGRTTAHTFNTTTAANVTFTPATIGLTSFKLGGFYITPASKTFNISGIFSVDANAGNLPGALAVTNTTVINAGTFTNNGQVGATGAGGTATITSNNFTGTGYYVTSGQSLTLATGTGGVTSGALKVAGDNTVILTGANNNTLEGGVQVQSGTLRVQPNAATSNPFGSGTVQVFGSPASVASATSAPIAAVGASLLLDSSGGAITHNGDITNSGTVRAVAGINTVAGVIKGTALSYTPGLLEGTVATSTVGDTISRTANPGNLGVRLEPRMFQTNAVTENVLTGWTSNRLFVYTGYIKDDDGIFSFAENIDDNVTIFIDGVLVLNANGNIGTGGPHNTVTSTAYAVGQSGAGATVGTGNTGTPTQNFGAGITLPGFGDGWHLIEIRAANGTGGAGATTGNGFGPNYGLGYKNGIGALDGADYIKPVDDGTGNLFVTPQGGKGVLVVDAGATLNAGAVDLTRMLTLSGTGATLNVTGNGSTNGGLSILDAVTLTAGSGSIVVANATHGLNLGDSTTPDAAGVLTVPASGTLTLGSGVSSGIINVYGNNAASINNTGGVTIAGGVVRVGSANALGDSSDTLTINGGTVASVDATVRTVAAMIIVGGNFTLGQLAGAVTSVSGGSGNLTFSNTINLGSSVRQVTVSEATADMTFSNVVSNGGLTKAGAGRLILSGNNTFSGSVTVNAGVLNVQHANGLGTTTGTTTVNSGGTLQLQGGITTAAESLTLNGAGAGGQSGALVNASGSNNFTGAITLGSNATISSDAGTLTLSSTNSVTHTSNETLTLAGAGDIAITGGVTLGSGGLVKTGAGTATLSGTNAFTGALNVNAGALTIASATALGSPSVINVADGSALNLATGGTTFTLPGTGSVLNVGTTGGARLGFTINGATNDMIDLTNPAGTVAVAAGGAFADIYVTGAPTLGSYVLINTAADNSFTGAGTFSIGSIFNGGSFIYDLITPTAADSINDQLILQVTAGITPSAVYWKGDLAGSGTGVWIASQAVSGNRTNWSTTQLTNTDAASVPGLLGTPGPNGEVASYFFFSSASPANLATTLGADTTAQAVTFLSGNPATTVAAGNTLTIMGAAANALHLLSVGDGITLQAGAGSASFANDIILGAGQNWSVADSGNVLTVSGSVSDGGSAYALNLNSHAGDLGTIVLSGANTYTGTTTLNRGILNIQSATALGGVTNGTTIANGATLQFQGGFTRGAGGESVNLQGAGAAGQNGALVNVSGDNTWATQIVLAGHTTISSDAGMLTLNAATAALLGTNTDLTLTGAGNITLSAFNIGAGTLTKNGLGTLTLTAASTYTGLTTINAGIVNLRHVDAFGSDTTGAIVNSGGTLQLQGGLTFTATDEALTISGTGAAGQSGALVSLSGTNAYNRTLTLGGDATIGIDAGTFSLGNANAITGTNASLTFVTVGNATVSGIIATGSGGLTKNGLGTLFLSGANSFAGATAVTAGIVNIQNGSALGTAAGGTTVSSGATLQVQGNINVASEALTVAGTGAAGQNGAVVNVSGTNTLGGAVTISGHTTLAAETGTLNLTNAAAITGTDWDLTFVGAGNISVSGAIALGAGGVTKTGTGTLTLSGASTYAGATAVTAGIVNVQNDTGLGSAAGDTVVSTGATLQLQGGITSAESISLVGAGASGQSGALVNMSGNNTITGLITTAGNTTIASLAGLLTLDAAAGPAISGVGNLTFTGAGNITVADAIVTGPGTLTKTGTGTLTLSGANTYTGITTVQQGTLVIGANNTLVTNSNLTLGANAGTAGTVDLTNFSQTVGSMNVVTNSAANTNQIIIGAGQTLQVNGNVTVGYNVNGNTTTKLNVSGEGAFSVTATAGTFQVGGGTTTNVGSTATLDMSGLATFTASIGTGTFRVGDDADSGGGGIGSSTALLAANSTITAAAVDVESDHANATQTLRLGTGNGTIDGGGSITTGGTVFNVGTLNVGFANGRSNGVMNFQHATNGTFKLRNQAGNGRAAFNVGTDEFTAGADTANTSSADFDGHYVDLLVGTLTVASRAQSTGSTTATLALDTGKLDATSVVVGARSGTSTSVVTGTLDIGGGNVTIGATGLSVANVTGTATTANAVTGTVLISGGTVSVGSGGITLGTAVTAGTTAVANLSITGGTVTMGGNIVEGTSAGTVTSTLTLDGGALNMGNNSIGFATSTINNVNLQSGTLSNVAQINNGAAIAKTTAGTLVMTGSNNYTGATNVDGGTFQVGDGTSGALLGTGTVTVNNTGSTLSGSGAIAGSTIINSGAILAPGVGGTTSSNQTLTFTAAGASALQVNTGGSIQLGITSPTTSNLVSFDGQYTYNGNNYATALSLFNAEAGARNEWNNNPAAVGSHDFIDLTGAGSNLVVNGSIEVLSNGFTSVTNGQVFNLIDWTQVDGSNNPVAMSFNTSNLILHDLTPLGLAWDTSAFTTYGIIVVVPEPSRMLLLMLGLFGLFFRRRRSRSI